MKSRGLLAAALLACLWITETPVDACSCIGTRPPCEATWQAAVVFTGTATAIEPASRSRPEIRQGYTESLRRVTFRVTEAFRGVDGKAVVLDTGASGASCGYDFEPGQDYLVYAHRSPDGRLSTGICSRTRPISEAAEDLAYLRGPARESPGFGTIQGAVREQDPLSKEYLPFDRMPPHAGARVTVEALDPRQPARYQSTTGVDGRFAVQAPVGKYRVTLDVSDGLYATRAGTGLAPELLDPRGCAQVDFVVLPDSRLSGRILDADGGPVSSLSVEMLDAQSTSAQSYSSSERARTDESGRFEFIRLRPDSYVLGLTLQREVKKEAQSIFLRRPSVLEPERFAVAAGERVWAGEFRLPESVALTRITGIVSDETGQAPAQTHVYVFNAPEVRIAAGPVPVDQAGRFSFTVIAGRQDRISGEQFLDRADRRFRSTASEPFTAAPGDLRFALRFDK